MSIAAEITDVINSLRRMTGVGICFYDLENFFSYNALGMHDNCGHYCEFCRNAKLLPDGRRSCDKSDRFDAIEQAKSYRAPFFFRCHMGMCELVLPLFSGEILSGIVFIGQCRIPEENNGELIEKLAEREGGAGDRFRELYDELPSIDRETLLDIGRILSHYFRILTESEGAEAVRRLREEEQPKTVPERICRYISTRYMQNITPGSICRELFLNPSYVSRCFRSAVGMTMTEYLQRERIGNAKRLLKNSNLPVNRIAVNVGFEDANYFSRIFRRSEGVTPEEWRKECLK